MIAVPHKQTTASRPVSGERPFLCVGLGDMAQDAGNTPSVSLNARANSISVRAMSVLIWA